MLPSHPAEPWLWLLPAHDSCSMGWAAFADSGKCKVCVSKPCKAGDYQAVPWLQAQVSQCHTVGLQLVGGQGEVGRREWAAVLKLSFMEELHLL